MTWSRYIHNPDRECRPKRGSYRIALRLGGTETVKGWVCGDFAARRGRYGIWDFTHIPSGMGINTVPSVDNLADAKQRLIDMSTGKALKDYHRKEIATAPLLEAE